MYIQNADAVAGELRGLMGIVREHRVDLRALAGREAAPAVADRDLHRPAVQLPRRNGDAPAVALVLQPVQQTVFHDGL